MNNKAKLAYAKLLAVIGTIFIVWGLKHNAVGLGIYFLIVSYFLYTASKSEEEEIVPLEKNET